MYGSNIRCIKYCTHANLYGEETFGYAVDFVTIVRTFAVLCLVLSWNLSKGENLNKLFKI